MLHGFLNVFLAAAFAWHGEPDIEPLLAETDPAAFRFDTHARLAGPLTERESQVRAARTDFAHAFGSCSFTEPVRDLELMGLL